MSWVGDQMGREREQRAAGDATVRQWLRLDLQKRYQAVLAERLPQEWLNLLYAPPEQNAAETPSPVPRIKTGR